MFALPADFVEWLETEIPKANEEDAEGDDLSVAVIKGFLAWPIHTPTPPTPNH